MHKTLKELTLLTPAQTEKELRTAPWLRSIRLDVYALDKELSVYSTEMQKEYRNDLVKRGRYYQSLIDSPLLEPGSVNFNQLNITYMILIMPFDLFGLGRYCYTFQNCCREEKVLERQAGKAEGRVEGKAESIIELLEELGPVPEELRKKIMKERDAETLKGGLKLAAKAASVEDFCFLLDSREKI